MCVCVCVRAAVCRRVFHVLAAHVVACVPLLCRESVTLAMHCESYTHVLYIVRHRYVYDVCAACDAVNTRIVFASVCVCACG